MLRTTAPALTGGGFTDRGRRAENQDSIAWGETPAGLYAIVADGMGGGVDGQVFSQRAVTLLEDALKNAAQLDGATLRTAMHAVVAVIAGMRAQDPKYQFSGTTMVAAVISRGAQPEASIINIGDSRAYIIHSDGTVEQLTRDHSYAEYLITQGWSYSDAYAAQQARRLTHVLGDALDLDAVPQLQTRVLLEPGDRLMLCTDGISRQLTQSEIAARVIAHPPLIAAEQLGRAATAAGAHDNVSAIVIGDLPALAAPLAPRRAWLLPLVAGITIVLAGAGGFALLPRIPPTVPPLSVDASVTPLTVPSDTTRSQLATTITTAPMTSTPAPSLTLTPSATPTSTSTSTPRPPTRTPRPATRTLAATATAAPLVDTPVSASTDTPAPAPIPTDVPVPPIDVPTPAPAPTDASVPAPTDVPVPPTDAPAPVLPTDVPPPQP